MNKKIIPVILLAGIAAAAILYRYQNPADNANDTTLYGNVDIREVPLAFRVGGRVAEVKVDEGASVKQGDVLAVLDTEPLHNSMRGVEATVAALTARNMLVHNGYRSEDVAQAKAAVNAAKVALAESERQFKRQHELVSTGAATQQTLDTAQSLRDQSAAQLTIAEQKLRAMSSGFRKEEVDESDAQLEQARVSLDIARLALRDATLLAPSDGIILTRAIEQGSMVQAGVPAFSLSLRSPVWVRAYVNEPMLGKYASGTAVVLSTDSRPQQPYHGVVGFVSPVAEFTPKAVETSDLRTSLVYRLRIVVNDADEQLRQGMPVTIRLAQ